MILYRLLRYFVLLFILILSLLFAARKSFVPFPFLEEVFTSIEGYYHRMAEPPAVNRGEGNFQKTLSSASEEALASIGRPMEIFITREDLGLSLEDVMNRRFDDIEYLVRTSFVADEAFKDFRIKNGTNLLYKYENIIVNAPLIVTREISVGKETLTLEAHYSSSRLAQALGKQPLLGAKLKSELFLPEGDMRSYEREAAKIAPETLQSNFGVAATNRNHALYYLSRSQNLGSPLVFFMLETLPPPTRSYNGLIFTLCLLFSLFSLFFVDRMILRSFQTRRLRREKTRHFSTMKDKGNPAEGASLEWLENLAAQDHRDRQNLQNPPEESSDEP